MDEQLLPAKFKHQTVEAGTDRWPRKNIETPSEHAEMWLGKPKPMWS